MERKQKNSTSRVELLRIPSPSLPEVEQTYRFNVNRSLFINFPPFFSVCSWKCSNCFSPLGHEYFSLLAKSARKSRTKNLLSRVNICCKKMEFVAQQLENERERENMTWWHFQASRKRMDTHTRNLCLTRNGFLWKWKSLDLERRFFSSTNNRIHLLLMHNFVVRM